MAGPDNLGAGFSNLLMGLFGSLFSGVGLVFSLSLLKSETAEEWGYWPILMALGCGFVLALSLWQWRVYARKAKASQQARFEAESGRNLAIWVYEDASLWAALPKQQQLNQEATSQRKIFLTAILLTAGLVQFFSLKWFVVPFAFLSALAARWYWLRQARQAQAVHEACAQRQVVFQPEMLQIGEQIHYLSDGHLYFFREARFLEQAQSPVLELEVELRGRWGANLCFRFPLPPHVEAAEAQALVAAYKQRYGLV